MDSRLIKDKIAAALMRSGYVMESRLVSKLTRSGFFVEPNQKLADPKTGKAREIDFVAELWDSEPSDIKAHLVKAGGRSET
jgi:hypothetical protein